MANEALMGSFGLDIAPLSQSLNRATAQVADATKKMGAESFKALLSPIASVVAAVASVGAVMAGLHGALELGAEMTNLSNRTGIAVENLMGLRKAFKDNGVDAAALGGLVNKMQKALATAATGGKGANLLKSMGLDPQELASAKPDEAFRKIGAAIDQLPNQTEKAKAAMEIFGRTGGELLQVFGSPQFKEAGNVSNTAKLLGQNAAAFKEAEEALSHVGAKISGFFVGMASGFVPMLSGVIQMFEKVDLSGIGKSIGDAIGLMVAAFSSGNISTIIGLSLKIGAIEFVNFLSAGIMAIFQTLPSYLLVVAKLFISALEIIETPSFWDGVKNSFLSVAAAFRGTMLMGVENILRTLQDNLPDWLAKKAGKGADKAQRLSEDQFAQSAKYGEMASNSGVGALLSQYGNTFKTQIASLGGEFSNNFKGNGKILGGTEADQAKLSSVIADTIKFRDEANAKGREEANAKYNKPTGAFDPADIGDAKTAMFSDSLAKIGGGGNVTGGGDPILDENRRQTQLLQQSVSLQQQMLASNGGGTKPASIN
jgi:hypothetical protein